MLAMRRLGLLVAAVAAVAVLLPSFVHAASILSMGASITVVPDASIQVVETITTEPLGPHGIYRDIPLSFTSADGRAEAITISDVSAKNESGTPYQVLTSFENGKERIRIGDPNSTVSGVKTYVISYTVRGAITPYDTFDELYWNATGDGWSVPIATSSAKVVLSSRVDVSQIRAACYIGVRGSHTTCPPAINGDDRGVTTVFFAGPALSPGQGLTVAVGFPKGLVAYPAWWEAILQDWGLTILASLLFLAAIAYALWRVRTERAQGRGTIIPIYEPPSPYEPAQVDVLVHGWMGKRAWPATVVDLAVRGFVKIAEDAPLPLWRRGSTWAVAGAVLAASLLLVFIAGLFSPAILAFFGEAWLFVIIAVPLVLLVTFKAAVLTGGGARKDYLITEVTGADRSKLEDYEGQFLDKLFSLGTPFSTREMRRKSSKRQALFQAMQLLEKDLLSETATDTKAYTLEPKTAHNRLLIASVIMSILIGGFFTVPAEGDLRAAATLLTIAIFTVVYATWMRSRLNKGGSIEREAWLGFKLYLETAEKYRLQNLTPNQFQKFLPYAMVFGIEKKWAKAFEGIAMPPPDWYSGSAAAGAFSASSFTSGFSSSFSSSFASSGASGASGGGGGAGGGGGGGGGGGW